MPFGTRTCRFARLVEVDGIEETKDGLTAVRQVVGEHEKLLWVFIVVPVVVVVMEVVVGVMDFVGNRPLAMKSMPLAMAWLNRWKGSTESHDDDA